MKKALSSLLVFGLLGFLLWNIVHNWQTATSIKWDFLNTNGLFLLLFLFLVYLVNVTSWHMVTKALGANVPLKKNFRIWMYSNLSRFLPGGIWQYPSRVYLLSRTGVSGAVGVTAVLLEGLLNLSMGASTIFLSLIFWRLPEKAAGLEKFLWMFLFLPLLMFILTNQNVSTYAIRFIKKVSGREGRILKEVRLSFRELVPLSLAFLGRFIFIGGALFFLINATGISNFEMFPIVVGIFAFSWLLGYIILFAPGGLGVVEISLASLLSLYIPFTTAAVVAVTFRILLFFAEAIFLGISFLFLKREAD